MPLPASVPIRSLAGATTGQPVRIHRILFGGLRALCSERGLNEGDTVVRLTDTGSHIEIATADGRNLMLTHEWARFIQVTADTAAAEPYGWEPAIAG